MALEPALAYRPHSCLQLGRPAHSHVLLFSASDLFSTLFLSFACAGRCLFLSAPKLLSAAFQVRCNHTLSSAARGRESRPQYCPFSERQSGNVAAVRCCINCCIAASRHHHAQPAKEMSWGGGRAGRWLRQRRRRPVEKAVRAADRGAVCHCRLTTNDAGEDNLAF